MNFMPYEVRAAVMILMARANILALPGGADAIPPSKWKWTADQTAAFRAFADRHGYVFSSAPEYGRQPESIKATLNYIIVNDVRKRESALDGGQHDADSAPALAVTVPASDGAATDGAQYDDDDVLGSVADGDGGDDDDED